MADALGPAEIYRAYNDAENAQDSAAMAALVAADLRVEVNGRAAVASAADDERAMRELFGTYANYRREIEEIVVAGNRATVRWRMRGDPRVEGVDTLDVAGCSVVSVSGATMTEAFLYYDGAALDAVLARAGGG